MTCSLFNLNARASNRETGFKGARGNMSLAIRVCARKGMGNAARL
jgi:hypothetical protein